MNRTLLTVALALFAGASARAQTPAPTADQIIDKYVEAIGGRAAFDQLTSRVLIGSFENEKRRLTVPLEIDEKPPNRRVEILGFGEASNGFNGEVGWSLNTTQNGLRELSGPGLARIKRESEFNREIKLKDQYSRLSLAGSARVAGREAYVIEAVPVEGRGEKLYFDTQSGLLVRRDVQGQITPDGQSLVSVAIEIYFEDYRTVGGVKLPFTIRRKLPGDEGTFVNRFREIKVNVPIDDSKFSVPNP